MPHAQLARRAVALLIEDDSATRLLQRTHLESAGYVVNEARDGIEGLELFGRLHPDIVLLDCMMPRMDGFETCERIVQMPGGSTTPIVMMTALDDQSSINRAFRAGATDFVTKPINWTIVLERMRWLIQAKLANEALRLRDQAIEAVSHAIIITDVKRAGHPIIYVNRAFSRLTGHTENAALQHGIELLLGGQESSLLQEFETAALSGAERRAALVTFRRDGRSFWSELAVSPIQNHVAQVTHLVWVQQDITERKQREQERQSQLIQESALVTMIKELNRTTSLDNVLDTALQQAIRILSLDRGVILLYEGEADELVLCADVGFAPEEREVLNAYNWNRGLSAEVATSGRTMVLSDMRSERPDDEAVAYAPDTIAQVSLPLYAAGSTVGVMSLFDLQERQFDQREIELVEAIADQVGTAIERARLYESLRDQSIRDPLTHLYNRRYMEEVLQNEVSRAERGGHSLCVMMLDLDHFKHFNDSYGHEAGDAMLRALGPFLQGQVRHGDIPCRYGGEEFILILPNTPLDVAKQRGEQICLATHDLVVPYRTPLGGITLSIGIACYPEHGSSHVELLRAADRALYAAKAAGRDRVHVAESPPQPSS